MSRVVFRLKLVGASLGIYGILEMIALGSIAAAVPAPTANPISNVALKSDMDIAVDRDVSQLLEQLPDPLLSTADTSAGRIDPGSMDQVTSVSQLTDVKPTDWAFQALQSLVERYGCISGYPDRTYRGNRALTRYEFAAGLNACMDRVNELIAAATNDMASKEDLATLQKLQEEFAAELATLRGRVDAVEAKVGTLEKQQFSTTTKLFGSVWVNVTGATAGKDVRFEGPAGSEGNTEGRFFATRTGGQPTTLTAVDPEITESFLAWLTLVTSFSGKDQLVTQLASGNGRSPYNQYASAGFYNASGVPFFDQTAGTTNGSTSVIVRELFYSFPVSDAVKLTVGPPTVPNQTPSIVVRVRYLSGN
jgi:Carbohydrate-selective porin, OprB family/S-layer homology domain